MPVSHKYRTLYFHIPKTAGTSVENMLELRYSAKDVPHNLLNNHNTEDKPAYQHFVPRDVQPLVSPEVWETYHKCVTVRNPYDRAVSAFEYCKKNNTFIDRKTGSFHDYLAKAVDIVEKYDAGDRTIYDRVPHLHHYRPQKHWFVEGNNVYDTVIRYEHLQDDIQRLQARVDCPHKLPHVQSTRKDKSTYMAYFDKNALLLFERAFGADFDLDPASGLRYDTFKT